MPALALRASSGGQVAGALSPLKSAADASDKVVHAAFSEQFLQLVVPSDGNVASSQATLDCSVFEQFSVQGLGPQESAVFCVPIQSLLDAVLLYASQPVDIRYDSETCVLSVSVSEEAAVSSIVIRSLDLVMPPALPFASSPIRCSWFLDPAVFELALTQLDVGSNAVVATVSAFGERGTVRLSATGPSGSGSVTFLSQCQMCSQFSMRRIEASPEEDPFCLQEADGGVEGFRYTFRRADLACASKAAKFGDPFRFRINSRGLLSVQHFLPLDPQRSSLIEFLIRPIVS